MDLAQDNSTYKAPRQNTFELLNNLTFVKDVVDELLGDGILAKQHREALSQVIAAMQSEVKDIEEPQEYDCTQDVLLHVSRVRALLAQVGYQIFNRSIDHDASKLRYPEKEVFDAWTPALKKLEFGSDDYNFALEQMGVGLQHHYAANRHHPEHFTNGIDGMNLIDLLEMVCDWIAAAYDKPNGVNLGYLANRFKIDLQLHSIIANTLKELDP